MSNSLIFDLISNLKFPEYKDFEEINNNNKTCSGDEMEQSQNSSKSNKSEASSKTAKEEGKQLEIKINKLLTNNKNLREFKYISLDKSRNLSYTEVNLTYCKFKILKYL